MPSPTAAKPAPEWRPRFNPWLVAASVMLATFMEVLDTSVANVALPHIAGSLAASQDESTWVLTSYLVSNAIILPATGWMGAFFGRKRFLVVCILIFTVASALCGVAANLNLLIVARILQGAGGGALQPIAQAVLLESFPTEKRGQAMAVYAMGVVVAPILGPTLGGWITDNYSWRWIFYINLPIGILAAVMASAFVEDPPYLKNSAAGRMDYVGFGLMAIALATLQIVLDKGQDEDWFSSGFIRAFTAVCVVTTVAFLVWELRVPNPIVRLRVLANRNFAVGVGLITVTGAVLYATTAILPLFLQSLLGYPALQSGMALSPRGAGALLASAIIGRLVGRVDSRFLIGLGFFILAWSCSMLGNITLDISRSTVLWPVVLNGIAVACIFVPLSTLSMGTLSREEIGNATGIYNLARNLGGSFGISLVTAFVARRTQSHQALLAPNLNPFRPEVSARLAEMAHGLAAHYSPFEAMRRARGLLYQTLTGQAALFSYVDNFRFVALLCVACVPLVFFFRKARAGGEAVMAH